VGLLRWAPADANTPDLRRAVEADAVQGFPERRAP
jgi:hypothetical protein